MTTSSRATAEGTRRFAARMESICPASHFRDCQELKVSSLGIGTYLGASDDKTDALVEQAILQSVTSGVNLIDTAINYRFQRAERSVGRAIARLIEDGTCQRDELVVCSKAGYLPENDNPTGWFEANYLADGSRGIQASDLVDNSHCMHPAYIKDQIRRSLDNTGLSCIDIYYLHNPEAQLGKIEREQFYEGLRVAFGALEEAVAAGWIGCYGVASWKAFRVEMKAEEHISLARIKNLAGEAASSGADHLRVVQLPFNLAMPEALLASQPHGGELFPVLELARQQDLAVVTSAALCQGQIIGQMPKKLGRALGKNLTAAQQCLQFARSTPGITTALVGMKTPAHLEENLALTRIDPLNPEQYLKALG
jgi:aryl-alcohol dehydrogenase-like predicted oxidoreductase